MKILMLRTKAMVGYPRMDTKVEGHETEIKKVEDGYIFADKKTVHFIPASNVAEIIYDEWQAGETKSNVKMSNRK
jgi:hypothetical protein